MLTLLESTTTVRQQFVADHRDLLQKLGSEGQDPQALFIGCSDARVLPEQMFQTKPGSLFMLRNIANIVPPYTQTEIGIVSVLEYAVLELHVPHVILCGHTDCGGIKALDSDVDMMRMPALSRWLTLARPAQRDVDFHVQTLSPEARHLAIVEQNVVNQLRNLQSYPFVREALAAEQLTLHGWVYDVYQQQVSFYDEASDQFHLFTSSE